MKIKLSEILDAAFYLVAGFFLSLIAFNYFLPRPASYVLSATLAVIFTLFAVKICVGKNRGNFSESEKERKFLAVMTTLNLSGEKANADLFEKVFRAEGYAVEKKRGGLYIADLKRAVFFRFGFDGETKTDVVKCFNKIPKDFKAEIFSESFDDGVKEFAGRFGGKIVLSDGRRAYELLEKNSLLPEGSFVLPEKSVAKRLDFRRLLDKKRAKNYLAFGLLFTFLSYFVPIKGYYLVFGAVFLIFALILRLFGKPAENKTALR